jgi:hypothetical protein
LGEIKVLKLFANVKKKKKKEFNLFEKNKKGEEEG